MLVFISYAHGDGESTTPDRDWVERIARYFHPAVRDKVIDLWWDKSIRPGDTWESEISAKLDEASVAILLVSPRFLASDYIYEKEMPRLLARWSEQKVVVIPLILETSDPDATFRYPSSETGPEKMTIASLQGANAPSKPLAALQDDEAVNQILMRLLAQVRELAGEAAHTKTRPAAKHGPSANTHVLVAGSGRRKEMTPKLSGVAHALGVELAANGFGLISGGWEGVDEVVTAAFIAEHERLSSSSDDSLVQVVQRGWNPPITAGEMITVERGDSEWIEQIVRSDAIVLIAGLGGTLTTGELGYAYGKPVLPLADTGYDAKRFYDDMLGRWDEYPMPKLSREEFKKLARPVPAVLKDVMDILRRLKR